MPTPVQNVISQQPAAPAPRPPAEPRLDEQPSRFDRALRHASAKVHAKPDAKKAEGKKPEVRKKEDEPGEAGKKSKAVTTAKSSRPAPAASSAKRGVKGTSANGDEDDIDPSESPQAKTAAAKLGHPADESANPSEEHAKQVVDENGEHSETAPEPAPTPSQAAQAAALPKQVEKKNDGNGSKPKQEKPAGRTVKAAGDKGTETQEPSLTATQSAAQSDSSARLISASRSDASALLATGVKGSAKSVTPLPDGNEPVLKAESPEGAAKAASGQSAAVPTFADLDAAANAAQLSEEIPASQDDSPTLSAATTPPQFSELLAAAQQPDVSASKPIPQPSAPAAQAPPPAPPEVQFAEANHSRIALGVHGQLLPNGGSMQLRLDPPELGAVNVTVQMRDGAMTASFETSNEQATRLLSHSLGDLKTALESQGVSVERLHVQQAPREQQSSGGDSRQQQDSGAQDHSARQEQQRREMLRRMWRRLSGGQDPLDLVA